MKTKRRITFLFLLFCLLPISFNLSGASADKDIYPLKSGAENGLEALTLPHISHRPIASVFVYGSEYPDLFLLGSTGNNRNLFLCKWIKNTPEGSPVFDKPVKIDTDFSPVGTMFQTEKGEIYGFWIDKRSVLCTVFDKETLTFSKINKISEIKTPANIRSIAAFQQENGSYDFIMELNGVFFPPKYKDQSPLTEEWRPYDEAGVSTQGRRYTYLYSMHVPDIRKNRVENIRQVSDTNKEVYFGMMQMSPIVLDGNKGLITGSRRGLFPYYEVGRTKLSKQKYIASEDGNILYHPSISPGVCAYGNKKSNFSDFIAGGEGAIYFYKFTGEYTQNGFPIFKEPQLVLQNNAVLYAGSLPSPAVYDWDGDGVEDLIVGNSEGFVLFFKNIGSNDEPRFIPRGRIQAGGKDIHVQAGYSGSVQGTQESRWGYVSPTVIDWTGNGLPDIILGDITGNYTIYINRGTKTNPELEIAHPLYCEGLELHGMWRSRAAAGVLNDKLALIIVDDEDYFHLYWKIDDYNVEDGGKLKLADGNFIRASAEPAGGTGRCKLDLFDFDRDGQLDLIIGTGRRSTIPNMKTGYPWAVLGRRTHGTPLFMKNVGKKGEIVFDHPKPFHHTSVGLVQPGGAHETGAVGTNLGGGKSSNLIVANESGRLFLLKGDNMRFMELEEAAKYKDKRNPFPVLE